MTGGGGGGWWGGGGDGEEGKKRRGSRRLTGDILSLAACTREPSNSLPAAGFVNFVNAGYPAFSP